MLDVLDLTDVAAMVGEGAFGVGEVMAGVRQRVCECVGRARAAACGATCGFVASLGGVGDSGAAAAV